MIEEWVEYMVMIIKQAARGLKPPKRKNGSRK